MRAPTQVIEQLAPQLAQIPGKIQLRREKILVATGSSPIHLDLFPFGHGEVYDSETILKLDHIRKTLLVVGAGVMGAEYACTFRALGAEVHILDGRDVLLPFLDTEISQAFVGAFQRSGIVFHWREKVQKCIPLESGGVRLELSSGVALTGDLCWSQREDKAIRPTWVSRRRG